MAKKFQVAIWPKNLKYLNQRAKVQADSVTRIVNLVLRDWIEAESKWTMPKNEKD